MSQAPSAILNDTLGRGGCLLAEDLQNHDGVPIDPIGYISSDILSSCEPVNGRVVRRPKWKETMVDRSRRELLGAGAAAAAAASIGPVVKASKELAMPSKKDDRYARGLKTLEEITGGSGQAVVESLKDIAPDLAEWIIAFSYGDVMSRPGLDRRSRQFATVAALTATGTAAPQLKVHIEGALNVGCKPAEIVEVILQMAVYAGFPAAINGLNVAREVFRARKIRVPGS